MWWDRGAVRGKPCREGIIKNWGEVKKKKEEKECGGARIYL